LRQSSTTTGDIIPNEQIDYEFYVPDYASEEIHVIIKSESNLQIGLINCQFATDCPSLTPGSIEKASLEDIFDEFFSDFTYETKKLDENTTKLIIKGAEDGGCVKIVITDFFYSGESLPVCAYKLSLKNLADQMDEYEVSIFHKSHRILYPSVPRVDVISGKDTLYYTFYAPQSNLAAISF